MAFEEELYKYIDDQQEEIPFFINKIGNFNHRSEYYTIKGYLDEFINNENDANSFVVMPGLRGVGKSTILLQIHDYLTNKKNINEKNILFLSMERLRYYDTDLQKIVENFLEFNHKTNLIHLDKKIFVLVDECHYNKNWGLSGKIIYDYTKNIFLLFTGSSALELEMNGDIVRRSSKEYIFPNSFHDYLLLKYNINTGTNFSNILENLIYFGEEKYLNQAINFEKKTSKKLRTLNKNLNIEFNEFLKIHGFPFSLHSKEKRTYRNIFDNIKKVIDDDIPSIKTFKNSSNINFMKILLYLASQRPGTFSTQKIANYLSISSSTVHEMLSVLEKSQIIFNIKPLVEGTKTIKSSWKYYFLSPSLKAAISYELGRHDLNNRKCLGALAENYVASSLYKIKQKSFRMMGIFFPTEKKGTDFVIKTKLDDLVPIEVGIGKKTKSQLKIAINKYECEYGILISNRFNSIQKHDNIIHIPLTTFGFL
ncbi:ATP-binding protein [Methanobrevibacter curvatus]|uniref:AAA domain-containing protein n=1 Tax=Methanobrevibacter curvatus TaxID=49547 RepID=A0A166CZQ0_9EURY|nr:AAA family ATPase [Methanobrevibacter curvatus]KZX15044.1 hypothetical protein MBCUR_03280 [Methanobrevibacter curvatus]